jgi:hypothetical protein
MFGGFSLCSYICPTPSDNLFTCHFTVNCVFDTGKCKVKRSHTGISEAAAITGRGERRPRIGSSGHDSDASWYAAGASKFMMAANFFERGIDTLGSTPWKDETYEISLNLHSSCAEAYYCVGSFERMDVLLDAVFVNTRSFHDKLQAYASLVYANASRIRLMEALTMTFDVLKDLDETMPAAPGMLTISCQYLKTARMLSGKPDDIFLRQPTATDSTKATITMLSFAFFLGYTVTLYWPRSACFSWL